MNNAKLDDSASSTKAIESVKIKQKKQLMRWVGCYVNLTDDQEKRCLSVIKHIKDKGNTLPEHVNARFVRLSIIAFCELWEKKKLPSLIKCAKEHEMVDAIIKDLNK
jgi:hypothetical protein